MLINRQDDHRFPQSPWSSASETPAFPPTGVSFWVDGILA